MMRGILSEAGSLNVERRIEACSTFVGAGVAVGREGLTIGGYSDTDAGVFDIKVERYVLVNPGIKVALSSSRGCGLLATVMVGRRGEVMLELEME